MVAVAAAGMAIAAAGRFGGQNFGKLRIDGGHHVGEAFAGLLHGLGHGQLLHFLLEALLWLLEERSGLGA